ncbi:hypothetical protein Y032_0033g2771 [Ancylostoma ceylanicum]|uniref:Uncharacterized protein n=1 Tax=Ancylostoma ceylanicum TaxID=53326 RepID=A0A016UP74_9BILA|nr:hypothetical protein Y032_0033g2771 [Ancylostoma ceylanicum]
MKSQSTYCKFSYLGIHWKRQDKAKIRDLHSRWQHFPIATNTDDRPNDIQCHSGIKYTLAIFTSPQIAQIPFKTPTKHNPSSPIFSLNSRNPSTEIFSNRYNQPSFGRSTVRTNQSNHIKTAAATTNTNHTHTMIQNRTKTCAWNHFVHT